MIYPLSKVWNLESIPREFSFGTLPEDWDHIGSIFERSIHRIPALGECELQLFFNDPESFTPDSTFYLGKTQEVDRCYVAAGFNSVGIQTGGGVGWVIAGWIVDGHSPMHRAAADIRRSFGFQTDPHYLEERVSESLGLLYAMHWPLRQYKSARNIRMSPLHDRIDAAEAAFGESAGLERPNWYAPGGMEHQYEYSFGKQNWFESSGEKCRATRERVALFG